MMLVDLFTQLRVEGNFHLYAVCTGIPTTYFVLPFTSLLIC